MEGSPMRLETFAEVVRVVNEHTATHVLLGYGSNIQYADDIDTIVQKLGTLLKVVQTKSDGKSSPRSSTPLLLYGGDEPNSQAPDVGLLVQCLATSYQCRVLAPRVSADPNPPPPQPFVSYYYVMPPEFEGDPPALPLEAQQQPLREDHVGATPGSAASWAVGNGATAAGHADDRGGIVGGGGGGGDGGGGGVGGEAPSAGGSERGSSVLGRRSRGEDHIVVRGDGADGDGKDAQRPRLELEQDPAHPPPLPLQPPQQMEGGRAVSACQQEGGQCMEAAAADHGGTARVADHGHAAYVAADQPAHSGVSEQVLAPGAFPEDRADGVVVQAAAEAPVGGKLVPPPPPPPAAAEPGPGGSGGRKQLWGGVIDGKLVGTSRFLLHDQLLGSAEWPRLLSSVIAAGGGPIAQQELQYAVGRGLPWKYIRCRGRNLPKGGEFGPLDAWVEQQQQQQQQQEQQQQEQQQQEHQQQQQQHWQQEQQQEEEKGVGAGESIAAV